MEEGSFLFMPLGLMDSIAAFAAAKLLVLVNYFFIFDKQIEYYD